MKWTLLGLNFLITLTFCSVKTSAQLISSPNHKSPAIGRTVNQLSKNIMVVYQDSKSNYWFGSWENGVFRYDGRTIVNYTTTDGLPSNRIDEIKEDSSGNIFFLSCFSQSTIIKFDGQTMEKLTAIPTNDWKIQPGDLWFRHANQSEKVYRFDGITLHELLLPKPSKYSNPFEIYSIYKDRSGSVWFGTNPSGVCRFNGKSFDWITEDDVTEFRNEGANGVRSICEDRNGDFWFNTEYRYSVYNSATINNSKLYSRIESIGSLDGKKDGQLNEYLSCVKDDTNNLWFVTYRNGVWKYDGTKVTHYAVEENAIDITLFSIYKDKNGGLWIGTHENGAYKFNGTSFEKFAPERK